LGLLRSFRPVVAEGLDGFFAGEDFGPLFGGPVVRKVDVGERAEKLDRQTVVGVGGVGLVGEQRGAEVFVLARGLPRLLAAELVEDEAFEPGAGIAPLGPIADVLLAGAETQVAAVIVLAVAEGRHHEFKGFSCWPQGHRGGHGRARGGKTGPPGRKPPAARARGVWVRSRARPL